MKKLIVAIIIVVILGILAFRIVTKQRASTTEAVASDISKPVEVVQARRAKIESLLQLYGTIEPNSRVIVFPEIPGRLIEVRADEGSPVEKGEVLAVIDHDELELQLRQAEAAYQAAQTNHDQVVQLAEGRVKLQIHVAEADLSSARATFQQVKDLAEIRTVSQIEGAEAGLASLQANLEKIKRGAREEDRKQAKAAVDQAEASFANARNNYDRMKKLFSDGAISTQSFEAAQTQLDVAKAQYDVATEQIQLIENGAREEDVRAVEAQVRQAEASLKVAHAQIATRIWEKDITLAEAQVKKAEANLSTTKDLEAAKSWEVEIISAETAMVQAKAALGLAQERLEDATITAPISGIVSHRHLDLGGMASPTTPIFEVVEMDTVKAIVGVIESDLGRLKLKAKASIRVDALTDPVTGEISLISPTLESASRTAKVEIKIENASMNLKPGMFAKVTIPVEIHENAILIPRSSVLEDANQDQRSVFVVTQDVSERRQIGVGLSQGSDVEVISGLSEGDAVVIAGQHSLRDGEIVTVVNP